VEKITAPEKGLPQPVIDCRTGWSEVGINPAIVLNQQETVLGA
jgi:hypothetical protein